MQSRLPHIIHQDLASNIMPIKDFKLEKEKLPIMLSKITKELFLFFAQSIMRTLAKR